MKIGRYKRSFKVEPVRNPVPRREYEGPRTQPEKQQPARVRPTARA
jgi:hypothetical protein